MWRLRHNVCLVRCQCYFVKGFAYYQNEREDHDHQLMQLHAFVLGGTLKVQENGRPVEVLM